MVAWPSEQNPDVRISVAARTAGGNRRLRLSSGHRCRAPAAAAGGFPDRQPGIARGCRLCWHRCRWVRPGELMRVWSCDRVGRGGRILIRRRRTGAIWRHRPICCLRVHSSNHLCGVCQSMQGGTKFLFARQTSCALHTPILLDLPGGSGGRRSADSRDVGPAPCGNYTHIFVCLVRLLGVCCVCIFVCLSCSPPTWSVGPGLVPVASSTCLSWLSPSGRGSLGRRLGDAGAAQQGRDEPDSF